MVRGASSDDHMIQLKVVTRTLNSQKNQDQILKSGVSPPLDLLDSHNIVLRDDIARSQQNIASLPRPSLLPDLNAISH